MIPCSNRVLRSKDDVTLNPCEHAATSSNSPSRTRNFELPQFQFTNKVVGTIQVLVQGFWTLIFRASQSFADRESSGRVF